MLTFTLLSGLALASGTAPIADAGLGVLAYPGDTVILNGTGSSDVEGDALSYTWTQVSGSPVEFIDAPTAEPSFVIPDPGAYVFSLVVNDGTSDSPADEVSFYVPDREAQPNGRTGCATVDANPAGLAVFAGLALLRARRARRAG